MDGRPDDLPSRPQAAHRVGRLRFELTGEDADALMRLRARIAGGADGWVAAALEAAFEAVDRPGRTLRLARLEVDLGALPSDGALDAQTLAAAVAAAMRGALRDAPAGAAVAPEGAATGGVVADAPAARTLA